MDWIPGACEVLEFTPAHSSSNGPLYGFPPPVDALQPVTPIPRLPARFAPLLRGADRRRRSHAQTRWALSGTLMGRVYRSPPSRATRRCEMASSPKPVRAFGEAARRASRLFLLAPTPHYGGLLSLNGAYSSVLPGLQPTRGQQAFPQSPRDPMCIWEL